MEANKDMFEYYDELPKEVQAILDKYNEMDNNCDNCIELVIDLEEVGYTCLFGLDAIPYDLRPMNENELLDLL